MRQTITIGNPEGVGKKYSVEIGSSSYAGSQMFIVNDVFSEQEALDAAVDYCEEHGWDGLFWDDEEEARDYPDDFITAGNHGHLLPTDQIIVQSLNESKKQTIKLNESQLRKIVAESVKKVLKESLPTHDDNGTGIAYAGHEELAPNSFRGYYVCTPNDGVQYCRTKKDAISIVKQYYQGDDRNLVLGQLGTLGK